MHQRVSGHTAKLLAAYTAHALGRPMPVVLGLLKLPPDAMSSRDLSFTKARMDQLWSEVLELTQDEGLGLSLAQMLEPGMLGAVEYLFRNSRNLGDAYRQVIRFQNLLQQNTSRWSIDESIAETTYGYELIPPVADAHAHIAEFAMAAFVTLGRQVATRSWMPASMTLRHRRQAAVERYTSALGILPEFEADTQCIVVPRPILDTKIAGADEHLGSIVLEHVKREQAKFESDSSSDVVRRCVAGLIHGGDVTLKAVAEELGLSERTVRRKLADEQTSFQALYDEVRFDIVKAYLEQDRLTTEEIALLVGFSDVGAFYRAFRRWYGANLSDYRSAQSSR